MAYIEFNNNPLKKRVGDCVVRAIALAMNTEWETVYIDLMIQGYAMKDIPNANYVWGSYLRQCGFERKALPNTCPDCYTVKDFCKDYPEGTYILATGSHAVCVKDGDWYDTWNSGDETPIFYWERKVDNGI